MLIKTKKIVKKKEKKKELRTTTNVTFLPFGVNLLDGFQENWFYGRVTD